MTLLDDFKHAFRRYDNANVQLILINVIVFVVLQIVRVIFTLSGVKHWYAAISTQLMVPAQLTELMWKPWTVVTYFFFHEGLFHILFNMLFLYWFGLILIEFLGSKRMINTYVLGGLAGAFFYILVYNIVPYFKPLIANSVMLGASGAVYAVVVGTATLVPNYRLHLILIGPVKIVYIAAFYVLLSFLEITGSNPGGNLAHLGGALMGFIYIRQLQSGNDIGAFVSNFLGWCSKIMGRSGSSMRVSYKKNTYTKTTVSSGTSNYNEGKRGGKTYKEPTQEEIDRILDKISESGYESLTKEEKQKLFSASQK
jgi:membrane associated rhomboid family serine protease